MMMYLDLLNLTMEEELSIYRDKVIKKISCGNGYEKVGNYTYIINGIRFFIKMRLGINKFCKFSISDNILKADYVIDYEVYICGDMNLFYVIPISIVSKIHTDSNAVRDTHHRGRNYKHLGGYSKIKIRPNENALLYANPEKSINIKQYRNYTPFEIESKNSNSIAIKHKEAETCLSAISIKNMEVERKAVEVVISYLKENGWSVESKELEKIGYDLLCKRKEQCIYVEVKGISGNEECFVITSGEIKKATKFPKDFYIFTVTNALDDPYISYYSAEEFMRSFNLEVISYRAKKNK